MGPEQSRNRRQGRRNLKTNTGFHVMQHKHKRRKSPLSQRTPSGPFIHYQKPPAYEYDQGWLPTPASQLANNRPDHPAWEPWQNVPRYH